jgi:hypothetical protein
MWRLCRGCTGSCLSGRVLLFRSEVGKVGRRSTLVKRPDRRVRRGITIFDWPLDFSLQLEVPIRFGFKVAWQIYVES